MAILLRFGNDKALKPSSYLSRVPFSFKNMEFKEPCLKHIYMDANSSMLSVSSISPSNVFHLLTSLICYSLMVFQLLCSLFNNTPTDLIIKKCILPNSLSTAGIKVNLF